MTNDSPVFGRKTLTWARQETHTRRYNIPGNSSSISTRARGERLLVKAWCLMQLSEGVVGGFGLEVVCLSVPRVSLLISATPATGHKIIFCNPRVTKKALPRARGALHMIAEVGQTMQCLVYSYGQSLPTINCAETTNVPSTSSV